MFLQRRQQKTLRREVVFLGVGVFQGRGGHVESESQRGKKREHTKSTVTRWLFHAYVMTGITDFLIPSVSAVTCHSYWFYTEACKVRTQPGNSRLCGLSAMSCSWPRGWWVGMQKKTTENQLTVEGRGKKCYRLNTRLLCVRRVGALEKWASDLLCVNNQGNNLWSVGIRLFCRPEVISNQRGWRTPAEMHTL